MLSKSILSYRGPLSFSTIDWLLSEFKVAVPEHNISFKTYKKMVSVMIEALQNVSKYNDQLLCGNERPNKFYPSCQILCNETLIVMETSNPVKIHEVAPLRNRIDEVNSHNSRALFQLYETTITNGKFSSKGGAGLGFIEMAKTSGRKLEYDFEYLSNEYSLYTLRVSMKK
jgi:hypothetical protein